MGSYKNVLKIQEKKGGGPLDPSPKSAYVQMTASLIPVNDQAYSGVIYKFMTDELSMAEPHKRIEFQRIHHHEKPNRKNPRPILAGFLRYSDRQNVLELAEVS